jgi:hypothetical protein
MRCSVISAAALWAALSGCYRTSPVETAPPPGTAVVLDLTDQGRVALGPSIGSAAARVEGSLDSAGAAYNVKVTSVTYLNGQSNRWTNEPLRIQSDLVRELRVKRFSRGRTALVAGGSVGAVIALILTRQLLVDGSPETQPNPGEPGSEH